MWSKKAIRCIRKWTLFALLLNAICGAAQLENIKLGEDVNIDKLYVGLLANTPLLESNTNHISNSSLQLGVRASIWVIPNRIRFRSFGALKLNENQATNYIKSYEAIFSPLDNMEIAVGVMATPTTKLRPNPITWQSQVETNAERKIPGGKPGMKIGYGVSEHLRVSYGVHKHDDSATHYLKIAYKKFVVSSFLKDGQPFLAAKWRYKGSDFVMINDKKNTALSTIVPVSSRSKLYTDMEYDHWNGKLTFGEWGIRRHFPDNKLIRGFISISYNKNLKQFRGGLFVHI